MTDEQSPLTQRIDDLTDLFRRRLLEDRDKQRALDMLFEQLKVANDLAVSETVLPLARRLFVTIDRLDEIESDLAESVAAELEEALATHGIHAFAPVGQPFDPTEHEIIGAVEPGASGYVVESTRRRGWRLGDRVLRAASVQVTPSFPSHHLDHDEATEQTTPREPLTVLASPELPADRPDHG